jgi:uracil-DNA glycosylase family 4
LGNPATGTPIERQARRALRELQVSFQDCTACPLHRSALSVGIGGKGPQSATVMLVGQNPGRTEDLEGLPFIGKSGKLLDVMLRDAGFDPDEVYITNAVKCATPKDRAPLPAEAAACATHLATEIRRVRPQVIIALGEVAVKTLIGPVSIGNARGKEWKLKAAFNHDCGVWATYHPAWVLYSKGPSARGVVTGDLRKIRDRSIPPVKANWLPWTGKPFEGDVVAYDIETYDETGAITDRMTQAAISNGTVTFVSSRFAKEMLQAMPPLTIVSHFGWDFDDRMTGLRSDYDTAALCYLLDETQPLGLEPLCTKYLGVRGWKEERDGAKLGSPELAAYNARDAEMTIKLYHKARELLGDRIKIVDHMMRPARLALDAISARGIYIDPVAVAKHKAKTEELLDFRLNEVYWQLDRAGFDSRVFDKQLKTKVKTIAFNPNSNDHVAAVLRHCGFDLGLTKTGKDCVDKEALVYINHPFARAMLAYREVQKRMSTYILPYERITNEGDGRAHPHYTVWRTLTGRTSATDPSTQNLDRELKEIKAPAPGKVLVHADYRAIEFRMGAFVANERTVIANFARDPNWDPHTWFAPHLYEGITEADVTKQQRQVAKSGNFSQEFLGVGATVVSYAAREMGIFLTDAEGEHVHRSWHRAMPDWKRWFVRTRRQLIEHGYVESVTGRRRNFGDFALLNANQKREALREACNMQVQGFCADIAEIALGACNRENLPMVDFVHDDIKFEFDSMDEARAAEPTIRRCMIDEPLRVLREHFNVIPTVPLDVEITYQEAKGILCNSQSTPNTNNSNTPYNAASRKIAPVSSSS